MELVLHDNAGNQSGAVLRYEAKMFETASAIFSIDGFEALATFTKLTASVPALSACSNLLIESHLYFRKMWTD